LSNRTPSRASSSATARVTAARFSEAEIAEATAVLRERIAALEVENARLRAFERAQGGGDGDGVR
jgi:hypothetical protein